MTQCLKVNREFVKWKALYFLSAASQGPYVYFLVNFYLSRGLSYEAAGFIESIVPFLGCVFRPLACYFADRFSLHRCLLATSGFIYALSLLGFLALSTRYELIVQPSVNSTERLTSLNDTLQSANSLNATSTSVDNSAFIFPILCGLRFLSTIGITPATSLLDGIIYHALESNGQSANWGRQRLWGSIGFSLAVLFSAFLLDIFPVVNFVIGFSIALGAAVIFFVVSLFTVKSYATINVPAKDKEADDIDLEKKLVAEKVVEDVKPDEPRAKKNHFLFVIGFILRDGQILLVLTVAAAVGFLTACRDIFASSFVESITLTSSKKIMGVMQGVLGSLEIPVMFTAGWFFKKIGTMPFFAACFAAFSLRFWLYTLLTIETIWFFVAIELLHLFCFGFVVPAFTLHAHRRIVKHQRVLPEVSTIMQGLVSALYLGLGYGIGSIAGGVLTQKYGGARCMLIFSCFGASCFVVFAVVWLVMFIVSRKSKKPKQ